MPQDRIDSLAERAIKWASLTRKKNADKKLAVTVFSFPPDKGNVGTAAYLNVFGSIYRVLKVPPRLVPAKWCCWSAIPVCALTKRWGQCQRL